MVLATAHWKHGAQKSPAAMCHLYPSMPLCDSHHDHSHFSHEYTIVTPHSDLCSWFTSASTSLQTTHDACCGPTRAVDFGWRHLSGADGSAQERGTAYARALAGLNFFTRLATPQRHVPETWRAKLHGCRQRSRATRSPAGGQKNRGETTGCAGSERRPFAHYRYLRRELPAGRPSN